MSSAKPSRKSISQRMLVDNRKKSKMSSSQNVIKETVRGRIWPAARDKEANSGVHILSCYFTHLQTFCGNDTAPLFIISLNVLSQYIRSQASFQKWRKFSSSRPRIWRLQMLYLKKSQFLISPEFCNILTSVAIAIFGPLQEETWKSWSIYSSVIEWEPKVLLSFCGWKPIVLLFSHWPDADGPLLLSLAGRWWPSSSPTCLKLIRLLCYHTMRWNLLAFYFSIT